MRLYVKVIELILTGVHPLQSRVVLTFDCEFIYHNLVGTFCGYLSCDLLAALAQLPCFKVRLFERSSSLLVPAGGTAFKITRRIHHVQVMGAILKILMLLVNGSQRLIKIRSRNQVQKRSMSGQVDLGDRKLTSQPPIQKLVSFY